MQIIEKPGFSICFSHCHTSASDGLYDSDEVVFVAKKARAQLVVIGDHDTIDGVADAIRAGKKYGIHVLPGEEITSETGFPPIHILAYGIKYHIKPFLGSEETIEKILDQGGVPILAHPLRGSDGNDQSKMEKLLNKGIVGVEVQSGNSRYSPEKVGLAKIKTRMASSDSHHAGIDIDCSYTYFPGETGEDFMNALRKGETIPHYGRPVSIPIWDSVRQSAKSILVEGPKKYWVYRREACNNIRRKVSRNIFQIPKEIYSSHVD